MSIRSTQTMVAVDSADADLIAAVMRALSNPNRLSIFLLLREQVGIEGVGASLRVGEIAERLELTQSTVSHHLRELEHAGVIRLERKGKNVLCSVSCETVASVLNCLDCETP